MPLSSNSSRASTAESGVNSEGLMTTALPANNAGRASAIPSKNG